MDALTDHQRSVYLQFLEITSCKVPDNDVEEAKLIKFLSFHDWILETCIGAFFEKDGDLNVADKPYNPPPQETPTRSEFGGFNSQIPSSGNPILNEFLTRMKFPQIMTLNDNVISENMTKMIVQRHRIDTALRKHGYQKRNEQLISNLGRFSTSLKNSNSILVFLWPLVTILDMIWKGICYFIGLQFLLGENKTTSVAITQRKLIVPLPYFKFTDQLDVLGGAFWDLGDKNRNNFNENTEHFQIKDKNSSGKNTENFDGNKNSSEENRDNFDGTTNNSDHPAASGEANKVDRETSLLSLYDKTAFTDPTFKQVAQICSPSLVDKLSHIDLGKASEIQYDCKVKSNFLFSVVLSDSFEVLSSSDEAHKSAFILNKILASEEVAAFLKEKEQVKIHIGDLAYQVASWVQIRNLQGVQSFPCIIVMAKVDGLLSLLGKINLTTVRKPSQLINKINHFLQKFDVSLGLSLQRYELLELEYSRKLKEAQDEEFERTLRADEAKQTKKTLVNLKHLEYMKFAVNELLNIDTQSTNNKPCHLQIKLLDGSRLTLKLDAEKYTLKKLYQILETLQYLNTGNDVSEQNIRTSITDKVEECFLNEHLEVFTDNDDTIEELDEFEIEKVVQSELDKWHDKFDACCNENDFLELDDYSSDFPTSFVIVSPFPRKQIPKNETQLKDESDIYPRANLIIEVVNDDSEEES